MAVPLNPSRPESRAKAQDGMRRWKIGIVGGGPGGLLTAFFLERLAPHPLAITIFEASNRLGGKVLTEQFSAGGPRYEAGAAELYDYSAIDHDPLKELIEELRLPTLPMGGTAVHCGGQMLGTLEDVHDHLGPHVQQSLTAFDQRAKAEVSPREFYDAIHATPQPGRSSKAFPTRFRDTLEQLPPATQQFIEQVIHSDLATEPADTSHHYGLDNYLMNDPAYMRLYCIAGGNEQLIERLAARLLAAIRREHRVTTVSGSGFDGITLTWHDGQNDGHEHFDAVVLALPIEPLTRLSFPDSNLAGAMQQHVTQHDHPGHYLRISVLFERPFWQTWLQDSYCMLDAFGGCCLYDETAREPEPTNGVLGWLLGGQAATQWAAVSDDELIATAIDSLPRDHTLARQLLREGRVHRWIGAVSGQPGGFAPLHLDARHCPDPLGHPRLFVVGDYLFDSTLNGVLDSADHVAGWLAALMADTASPTAPKHASPKTTTPTRKRPHYA